MATNLLIALFAQINAASASATINNFRFLPTFPEIVTMTSYLLDFFNYWNISFFHQGIVFIVSVLIPFLQIKYQGSQETPFATHPKTTSAAVFTSVMYCLTYSKLQLRPYNTRRLSPACLNFLWHCMILFGNLTVASLASLFFPDSFRPFLYVLFAFLAASDQLLHSLRWSIFGIESGEFWGDRRRRGRRFLNTLGRILANYASSERVYILPR